MSKLWFDQIYNLKNYLCLTHFAPEIDLAIAWKTVHYVQIKAFFINYSTEYSIMFCGSDCLGEFYWNPTLIGYSISIWQLIPAAESLTRLPLQTIYFCITKRISCTYTRCLSSIKMAFPSFPFPKLNKIPLQTKWSKDGLIWNCTELTNYVFSAQTKLALHHFLQWGNRDPSTSHFTDYRLYFRIFRYKHL